jgi:hypothetical protein
MVRTKRTMLRRGAVGVTILLGASGCASVGGGGASTESDAAAEAARSAPLHPMAMTPQQFLANASGTYVVVDLDTNLLRVMDGPTRLWEAPVGTGTGLRLKGDDGEWHFSTPRGVFQIQYKEELPVWYMPDWYFVEKNLPLPPPDSPERKLPGQLGVAAVYLGAEIAIHGTNKPELLGQRVSHGCIRLANDYALRLFHNVQVGTPVVIIGGERFDDMPPPPTTDPGKPKPKEVDPLAGVPTAELLRRLDRALATDPTTSEWVWVTSRLITRGLKDDAIALRGLLVRAGTAKTQRMNREYATMLADVFSRGTLRAVVSLARIEPEARERAAHSIVDATMALFPGGSSDPRAPWPTRRVPPEGLGPAGRAGWEALAEAETAYRSGPVASTPAYR